MASGDKRNQILAGARHVFAARGFERASMDAIAARAGVSKATLYHHFQDKQTLFGAAIVEECDDMRAGLERCLARPVGDVEEVLEQIGVSLATFFLAPPIAGLYRQAVAVAGRFPEIGRLVFDRGTRAIQQTVAAHLARWAGRGALRIEDPEDAAVAFVALLQGDLATRSRLGILELPADEEVRRTVRRAVRIFVRAHRP